jgi:hypothetical protein
MGVYVAGRRKGADKAESKAMKADVARANDKRSKADEARNNPSDGDTNERLHGHGQLRD